MRCINPKCFGSAKEGRNLCVYCQNLFEATVVVGVCFGMCALIIAAAKLGRMI